MANQFANFAVTVNDIKTRMDSIDDNLATFGKTMEEYEKVLVPRFDSQLAGFNKASETLASVQEELRPRFERLVKEVASVRAHLALVNEGKECGLLPDQLTTNGDFSSFPRDPTFETVGRASYDPYWPWWFIVAMVTCGLVLAICLSLIVGFLCMKKKAARELRRLADEMAPIELSRLV